MMSKSIALRWGCEPANTKQRIPIMASRPILTVVEHPCFVHVDDSSYRVSNCRQACSAPPCLDEQANRPTECRHKHELTQYICLMISATPPDEKVAVSSSTKP